MNFQNVLEVGTGTAENHSSGCSLGHWDTDIPASQNTMNPNLHCSLWVNKADSVLSLGSGPQYVLRKHLLKERMNGWMERDFLFCLFCVATL